MDLFAFYRYVLGTVVTIYATLVTVQSLLGWYRFLSQPERYTTMLRRYLIVVGLRLRFLDFWADTTISLLLCIVFVIVWQAHGTIRQIGSTYGDAHRRSQPIHWRG